jgi:hypothetical protein
MNKLFALATIAAALLWSLFVWGTGVLLGGSAEFLAAQAAAWGVYEPEVELAVATATAAFTQWGAPLLWIVWGAGLLGLLVCAALAAMLAGALRSAIGRWWPRPAAAPQA